MTYFGAIILGFIEGATEFIPVSSSGHLILVRELLNLESLNGLAFDAILQLSSTFALIIYFRKDILILIKSLYDALLNKETLDENNILLYSILIGTIPAIVLGLLLENKMETIFRNSNLVAFALIFGSLLIYFSEKLSKENKTLSLNIGFIIGLFQSLALIPGISRSGATISGGLLSGLTKVESVRLSFLLSIPILLGSGIKKLFEVKNDLSSIDFVGPLIIGCIVSFIVGFLSINFLIKYLKNHKMSIFVWYRVVLALIIFIIL